MAPPAINENQNIVDKARDFVHEKVATKEQLQKEKPMDEKVKDAIPKDTQDLTNKVGNVLQNTKNDIKERFNERLDEGTEREQQRNQDDRNMLQKKVDNVKDKVYDATKSPSLKEREEFQQADLMKKLDMMQSMDNEKKKDSVPFATMMS